MVIELIGGVGAGKSRILRMLREEYGADVLAADQEAGALERRGQEGFRLLTETFGEGILGPDGELDRKRMAERIFGDREMLEQVNRLIHPLVWEEIHRKARRFRSGAPGGPDRSPLLVIETAVPDERPDGLYDEVWYVHAGEETRISRLMDSRGYSREKCLAVMASQCAEEEYRARADRVIDNGGSLDSVRRQIGEFIR